MCVAEGKWSSLKSLTTHRAQMLCKCCAVLATANHKPAVTLCFASAMCARHLCPHPGGQSRISHCPNKHSTLGLCAAPLHSMITLQECQFGDQVWYVEAKVQMDCDTVGLANELQRAHRRKSTWTKEWAQNCTIVYSPA